MTKSQLFSKCFQKYLCFLLHKFLKTLRKKLGLCHFCLDFSKKHRKSLEHRKHLEHSQIQKKSSQKRQSPRFFLCSIFQMDRPLFKRSSFQSKRVLRQFFSNIFNGVVRIEQVQKLGIFLCTRLRLVLKHLAEEQPDSSMPNRDLSRDDCIEEFIKRI